MQRVLSVNLDTARPISTKAVMPTSDGVPTDHRRATAATRRGPAPSREELDGSERELAVAFGSGGLGESPTSEAVAASEAHIAARRRTTSEVVLPFTSRRTPCAAFVGRRGGLKSLMCRSLDGSDLRVVAPGTGQAGDEIGGEWHPAHGVRVIVAIGALTFESNLLRGLLEAEQDRDSATRGRACVAREQSRSS